MRIMKMITKKLNKFERTRILSMRALELAEGAKPKVDISEMNVILTPDYVRVAEKEFNEGVLDLEIYHQKSN